MYTFSHELCERLDEAAEAQLRNDANVQSDEEPPAAVFIISRYASRSVIRSAARV